MNIFQELIDYIKEQSDVDMFGCITKTPCDTVGCIAGHLCLMKGYKPVYFVKSVCHFFDGAKDYFESFYVEKNGQTYGTLEAAAGILGLTADLANSLFHLDNWPSYARSEYNKCRNAAERKRAVIKRLQEFAGI